MKAKIGDTYLVTMTCWGPFTLAARMVGEETFMKATFKKPAFVEKMVDFCADLLIHVYEPLVQDGLECLSIADPTASGDLINKKQMERFAVPGLKKLTGWAKGKGVALDPAHLRQHQRPPRPLPRRPGRARSSSIRRWTWPRPREALAGKMSFGGNVAPVHVLLNQDVAGVEKACREVIEIAGGDARLHPGAGVRHPADDPLREPAEVPRRGAGVEALTG